MSVSAGGAPAGAASLHVAPPGASRDLSWRRRGACRLLPCEMFFPVGTGAPARAQVAAAKAVCARCEVREACLAFALETRQEFGVWGGSSEEERRATWREGARRPVVAG